VKQKQKRYADLGDHENQKVLFLYAARLDGLVVGQDLARVDDLLDRGVVALCIVDL
jgi:hypothetical protein